MANNNISSASSSDSECEYNPKYQNGKIYKIVCNNTGRIYIGSTYKTLEERLDRHEIDYKSHLKNGEMHYKTSFDIIKDNNYKIELIKDYPCNNKKELEREEGLHQREALFNDNVNCVNKIIAGRTKQEYAEDRKNYFYEKITCPCGGKFARRSKTDHFKTKKHQKYLKEKEVVEKMMREIITDIVNNVINHI